MSLTLLCCLLFPLIASSSNILGLMGGSSTSHHKWNKVIFDNLVAKGHNLTILSPDIDDVVTPGLHYILAEKVYPTIYDASSSVNIMDDINMDFITATISFYGFGNSSCTGFYVSQGFQTLLNYPDDFKFDLILVDYIFEPCLLGFVHKFHYPPTIAVNPFSVPNYIYDFIGGHTQPSYVSHVNVEYDENMTFFQRVHNFLAYTWASWYRKRWFIPQQEKAMRSAFRKLDLPSVETLQKSIVLTLTNTHFSIEKIEPLPPNVIPVGGLQIQEPKPLQRDLLQFVESSKNGVILFSLGTIVKSEFMDMNRKKAFIEAFRQLPNYNFIWKYESDIDVALPANVKIISWAPQNDILAHPKTKAFISHCGLLGTHEAVWYGIPVVGLPFFSDQYRNIRKGVREGTSIKLDYSTITVEVIKAALVEVLENPKYQQNAQRRSRLFKDQPEKPIDRAIFWIEWVIRHKDEYSAIQLPISNLGVFVSNSYDVIGFLLGILILIAASILAVIRKICFIQSKQSEKQIKTKRH